MGGVGSGDKLARGAASATYGPIEVSQSKWEGIFGKPEVKKKKAKRKKKKE